MLGELEKGMVKKRGLKGRLQWGALKVVFKGEVLDTMTGRLERAVQTLQLALTLHMG
jgi:hypothetical protein